MKRGALNRYAQYPKAPCRDALAKRGQFGIIFRQHHSLIVHYALCIVNSEMQSVGAWVWDSRPSKECLPP